VTLTLLFPIALIDAPIVISDGGPEDADVAPIPWVRVERNHIPARGDRSWHILDVVHRDHLETFIENELMPFAETVASRAVERLSAPGLFGD
jgi:hypothetical protein